MQKLSATEYLRTVPPRRPITGAYRKVNGQQAYTVETPKVTPAVKR